MAAYRTATRLFPGLHLPLLGMGMEYQRMNNLQLADQLFQQVRLVDLPNPIVSLNDILVVTGGEQPNSHIQGCGMDQ